MKSEYEKMLNQEWYNATHDKDLISLRTSAQDLCFDYNHTRPSAFDRRETLLGRIFESLPENLEIVAPLWVDYGKHTTFGNNVFVNADSYFMDGASITIGHNVFIGPKCGFYTATHPENIEKRNAGLERALPITIGDNVWIGANVTVLPGVTIGEGCIIGAGSVVTKDIPARTVAVGSPCRAVRPIDSRK